VATQSKCTQNRPTVENPDFENAVNVLYEPAYRFARSLARNEADAGELTQEAFSRLFEKSESIRDPSRMKSWLFTTLHRVFLGWKRRQARWPEVEIDEAGAELPQVDPQQIGRCEAGDVLAALQAVDERYRVPLALFYMEDLSYQEIAALLDIPIGTVMSRISRGKDALRQLLMDPKSSSRSGILPFPSAPTSAPAAHEQ
jgi:RNA polymerase sigma-70 factor (ECF subfamily)